MDMLCVVVLSFCVLACAHAEFLPSQSPDGILVVTRSFSFATLKGPTDLSDAVFRFDVTIDPEILADFSAGGPRALYLDVSGGHVASPGANYGTPLPGGSACCLVLRLTPGAGFYGLTLYVGRRGHGSKAGMATAVFVNSTDGFSMKARAGAGGGYGSCLLSAGEGAPAHGVDDSYMGGSCDNSIIRNDTDGLLDAQDGRTETQSCAIHSGGVAGTNYLHPSSSIRVENASCPAHADIFSDRAWWDDCRGNFYSGPDACPGYVRLRATYVAPPPTQPPPTPPPMSGSGAGAAGAIVGGVLGALVVVLAAGLAYRRLKA